MANPAADPLKTQNPQPVPIDKQNRTAVATFQWMLEKEITHPIHADCALQTFIGGQAGFDAIAKDIEEAKEDIHLVCWGFDPGMALVRKQSNPAYPWTCGEPYGELLKRKAAQGIKVRLLVWYSPAGSAKQKSLVGYVAAEEYSMAYANTADGRVNETWDEQQRALIGMQLGGLSGAARQQALDRAVAQRLKNKPDWAKRQDYCTQWWRAATSGQIVNLEVRCRDGDSASVKASLSEEPDQPGNTASDSPGYVTAFSEKNLLQDWATHHQKPILIDYTHEQGRKAVGYVMGLNSLTDYWDTLEHDFDNDLREKHLQGSNDGMANLALKKGKPISRKPLQDYACRVQGSALQDVYVNFQSAWNNAPLLPKLVAASNATATPQRTQALPALSSAPLLVQKLGKKLQAQSGPPFKARVQVLRTQPQEGRDTQDECLKRDKSIKAAYFQASSAARNYIYLENQYFFYEEWARYLKGCRQSFMAWVEAAGKRSQDARLLHLMAVIPLPEETGMVPRTYDTLKSLGHAGSMPDQHRRVNTEAGQRWNPNSEVTQTAQAVTAPELKEAQMQDENGKTFKTSVLHQDGKSLGLKTLICKMITPNLSGQSALGVARDIYIHSKLLLVDDCYMTLGSANLNQRSMAVDSEINVATDSIPHNRDLRQRVWGMQTGDDQVGVGGNASTKEIRLAFERWEKLAQLNADAANSTLIERAQKIQGHLAKFSDDRTTTTRVG